MNGKWISVKDRLPEVGKVVLLYAEIGMFPVGTASGETFRGVVIGDRCSPGISAKWAVYPVLHNALSINPTHWMPLPEPPEEEV